MLFWDGWFGLFTFRALDPVSGNSSTCVHICINPIISIRAERKHTTFRSLWSFVSFSYTSEQILRASLSAKFRNVAV
ncbi:hypothetical protein F5Y12DRAFT_737698 [Xylaria sp. FL1777]|nr:hypothetical protein F5Y12DRAFT_737698 [Xylaria sp. FL1777]